MKCNFVVTAKKIDINEEIKISLPSSKSISNRLLVIRYLSEIKGNIDNLSDSEDTELLNVFLTQIENKTNNEFFCKNAGTTTRFLIALLCITKGIWEVRASQRMQERPILELLNILQKMGADITYNNHQNLFPLIIKGKELENKEVIVTENNLTSQIISALLLISPCIKGGLSLRIPKNQVSFPYIEQTILLSNRFGAKIEIKDNLIISQQSKYRFHNTKVEKDYSSFCFILAFICVWELKNVVMEGLFSSELQGDFKALEIFEQLGVKVLLKENYAILSYNDSLFDSGKKFEFDLTSTPDIFLPLAVCMYCKGVEGKITGLATQRVKESDRLVNIIKELNKMGKKCSASENVFWLKKGMIDMEVRPSFVSYDDHRMVMALSVCSGICKEISFDNIDCVKKSWPDFWKNITKLVTLNSTK